MEKGDNTKEFYSRKIAVTGATGMVGGHLTALMVQAGYTDITLVVRNGRRLSNMYKAAARMGIDIPENAVKVIETEITDTVALTEALKGIDTVFNCAARIMSGDMTTRKLIDNNVSIARSVVDASLACGVKKIIHISSIAALGVPTGYGTVIDESCEPKDITREAAYGQSKYYSEQEIWRGVREGLEAVVILPGVIIGEGEWGAGGSAAMIPLICSGIPFYTLGIMSFVDVRDVARAMIMLDAIPEAAGQRFILSSQDLTYKELITMGAEAAGKPKPFMKIGKGAINIAYGGMQALIHTHLMKDKGVSKNNLNSVIKGNRYEGSKIVRFCDFRYTPVKETVDRVVRAYMEEKTSVK